MEGAATFNLPFPFPQPGGFSHHVVAGIGSSALQRRSCLDERRNDGDSHPYYAVTDESGKFEFTDVPPGTYQIVAWHEGWTVLGKEKAFDVLTEREVQRPVSLNRRSGRNRSRGRKSDERGELRT